MPLLRNALLVGVAVVDEAPCAAGKRANRRTLATTGQRTDCGTHTGESVDCYAGETPEEAAQRAKRLEVRTRQETAFKQANEACALYTANRRLESAQEAAAAGLELARRVGTDLQEEIKEKPSGAEPR